MKKKTKQKLNKEEKNKKEHKNVWITFAFVYQRITYARRTQILRTMRFKINDTL